MDLLKMFLNLLSTRLRCNLNSPAEFQIDDTFSVPGVGTVVSGTLLQGFVKLNDTLLLGPDPLGQFQPMVIKSIHRKRMPVKEVRGGQTASFALKKVKVTNKTDTLKQEKKATVMLRKNFQGPVFFKLLNLNTSAVTTKYFMLYSL